MTLRAPRLHTGHTHASRTRDVRNNPAPRWSTATAEELIREAARLGASDPLLVLAACACARAVLHLTRTEDRAVCKAAIETAERWTRGEATRNECLAAQWAAETAARAAEEEWVTARAATAEEREATPAWDGAGWAAEIAAWAAAWAAETAAWVYASAAANAAANAAVRAAARAGEDPQAIHNAVRAVLAAEVMRDLAYNHAVLELGARVLGERPSKRHKAAWDEALASGALRALLIAWTEVESSDRDDKQEMLDGLVARAKEAL